MLAYTGSVTVCDYNSINADRKLLKGQISQGELNFLVDFIHIDDQLVSIRRVTSDGPRSHFNGGGFWAVKESGLWKKRRLSSSSGFIFFFAILKMLEMTVIHSTAHLRASSAAPAGGEIHGLLRVGLRKMCVSSGTEEISDFNSKIGQ